MHSTTIRFLAAVLGALAIALPARAGDAPPAAAASAIPIQAFTDNPEVTSVTMSPSGEYVALLIRNAQGRRQLVVADTATLKDIHVVAAFDDSDVGDVDWVNDRRLVFSRSFETDIHTATAVSSGLFAIDRDGKSLARLIRADRYDNSQTGSNIRSRILTADHELLRTLRDGSDDVVIVRASSDGFYGGSNRWHSELRALVPLRLDTHTGETHQLVARVPDHAREWMIDERGKVLGVFTSADGVTRLLLPAGKDWREAAHFATFGDPHEFALDTVGADGRVYVWSSQGSPDGTRALYALDLSTGRIADQPIVSLRGFDYEGGVQQDFCTHRLLGVHYLSDARGSLWFDPAMAATQKKIDEKLPGRNNLVYPAECAKGTTVLVRSSSDHAPAQFLLYDTHDDSLRLAFGSRPAIEPRLMADTDLYRIRARDGLEFPVWVTRPKGKGPWPTIVLVHGGPYLRGWQWEWDEESQLYASRGYLVVKPEFRGSSGYGLALEHAGYKQWGLAMQDDIADATRWAGTQGWADAARTCIVGASYGGYAALMGLVRYPELYRCGVAASAVADIGMMYETWWSDAQDDWRKLGMPELIGDPDKDADQLARTSPLKLAAQIRRPLLLEHGALDRRVPIEQADRLRQALQAANAPVTWLRYDDEAHGFWKQGDRADFYAKELEFLDRQIGAHAAAVATTPVANAGKNP